jgi:hypothetical protein
MSRQSVSAVDQSRHRLPSAFLSTKYKNHENMVLDSPDKFIYPVATEWPASGGRGFMRLSDAG